ADVAGKSDECRRAGPTEDGDAHSDDRDEDEEPRRPGEGESAGGDRQALASPESTPGVVDVGGSGSDPAERCPRHAGQGLAGSHRRGPFRELGGEDSGGEGRAAGSQRVVGSRLAAPAGAQGDAAGAGEPVRGREAADEDAQQEGGERQGWASSHAAPSGQKRTNSHDRQAGDGGGSNRPSAIEEAIDSIVASASENHSSSTSRRFTSHPSPRYTKVTVSRSGGPMPKSTLRAATA